MLRVVPIAERPSEVVTRAGLRLRAAREALGLSQQDMARACGAEPNRWSNWEGGRHLPDPLVMARALALFGVSLDWIFVGRLSGMPFRLAQALATSSAHLVADDVAEMPAPGQRAAG